MRRSNGTTLLLFSKPLGSLVLAGPPLLLQAVLLGVSAATLVLGGAITAAAEGLKGRRQPAAAAVKDGWRTGILGTGLAAPRLGGRCALAARRAAESIRTSLQG